jgi:hypothetical protein
MEIEKLRFSSTDDAFRCMLLDNCEAESLVLRKRLSEVERFAELVEKYEGELDIDALAELGLLSKRELESILDCAELMPMS